MGGMRASASIAAARFPSRPGFADAQAIDADAGWRGISRRRGVPARRQLATCLSSRTDGCGKAGPSKRLFCGAPRLTRGICPPDPAGSRLPPGRRLSSFRFHLLRRAVGGRLLPVVPRKNRLVVQIRAVLHSPIGRRGNYSHMRCVLTGENENRFTETVAVSSRMALRRASGQCKTVRICRKSAPCRGFARPRRLPGLAGSVPAAGSALHSRLFAGFLARLAGRAYNRPV